VHRLRYTTRNGITITQYPGRYSRWDIASVRPLPELFPEEEGCALRLIENVVRIYGRVLS
jgi:hypothetical protein